MDRFGERLKEARLSAGKSQRDVATVLGVSESTISRWETGRTTPRTPTAVRLARLLETSVEALAPSHSPEA